MAKALASDATAAAAARATKTANKRTPNRMQRKRTGERNNVVWRHKLDALERKDGRRRAGRSAEVDCTRASPREQLWIGK